MNNFHTFNNLNKNYKILCILKVKLKHLRDKEIFL